MIDFLLTEFNTGFAISLGIVLAIALMEGIGMLIGLSLINLVDQISPFDVEVNFDTDVSSGGLTALIGWLYLDRMPLLVWLILLLSNFAISGYSLNYLSINLIGSVFSTDLTYISAIILAIFLTRLSGGVVARVIPQNESAAISSMYFNGEIARITIGTARKNSPAEAVLTDKFKQKHYVMVAPDEPQTEFTQGQQIVLVEKLATHWIGIKLKL